NTATGMFVVDMGADTTEISVLSLGGIVISQLIKVGGNKMCENIIGAVKKEHNLLIGSKTAEKLLSELGYATDLEEKSLKVIGRNMITGFPTTIEITSQLVYDAIKDNLISISDSIKFILERTPPELTSDIIENGMYLTGGVSQIKNIEVLFSRETELDVKTSSTPIENIAIGLEKIASDRELTPLAYTMGGKTKR
ncbi:MAG: rod shape-determining protein, partial [Eubacterium sp.]|nr:rod shape-determining protein [Eubacterium sp.]